MSKTNLGIKRRCASCGTKFYDFKKHPIICPSCKANFDPEQLLKSRKGRGLVSAADQTPKTPKLAADAVDPLLNESAEIDDGEGGDDDNDDDGLTSGTDFVAPKSDDGDEAIVEDEEFIATLDSEDDATS